MNFLTSEFWDEIMGADKGNRFENLVEDLLKEIYPDINWNRTQKTHDGKKDFMVTLPVGSIGDNNTYWVECKNHESAISINTLSPTLVMAVIKNANGILFFSYSNLNNNAEEYLTQFADKVGKTIIIFDDVKLESEILKYPGILKKHFPLYNNSSAVRFDYPKLNCRVKFVRDVAYSYGSEDFSLNNHTGDKSLHVNETFCLDVFIRNFTSVEQTIQLKLKPEDFQNHFSVLNKKIIKSGFSEVVKVSPAGIYFKRIVFKLEKYAARTLLPVVYIYDNELLIGELAAGEVKGNWIINAPLIGSQYLNIIDKISNITSHRNCSLGYCLYGESGTGKTRLLKEVKDVLLENGYQIYSEDGDFQNDKCTGLQLIKRIVSLLSGLPVKSYITNEQSGHPNLSTEWYDNKIARFLYSKETSLTEELQKEAIEIFFELTISRSIAILIDNVQFFDEDLSILLNTILNQSSENGAQFLFVLSFNTDFLFPQTKAFQLFERLKRLSKEKPAQFFYSKIRGFEKLQAEQYVEHCIPGATELYPETFRYIIQKTGNFPLYIEQMLLFLNDHGAIKKREDFFYIYDVTSLHSLVMNLPEAIKDLISLRWQFIYKSESGHIYARFLKFITLFQKLPYRLIDDLGFQGDTLHELISLGILELTSTDQIVFHHGQFLIYFNGHLLNTVDKATALSTVNLIEKYELMQHYPAQYFIGRNTVLPNDPEVLKFGADCLLNECISTEYKTKFALYLYNSLKITTNTADIPVIILYTRICDDIKTYEEFSHALLLFEEVYREKFINYKNYLINGDDYFYFILRFVNSYLSVHKDKNAHEILLRSLNIFSEFSFTSDHKRKKARAELLNRLCVTYKSLNEPGHAESAADESLLLANEISDKKLIVKNYIDKGYIYYKDITQTPNLLHCWDMAWNIFNDSYDKSLEDKKTSAFYHKALMELIRNNRNDALKYANEALRCAELKLDVFNRIKILLTLTIIRFLKKSDSQPTIENMAKEAIDLCASNNSIRSYWTSWHLLGKVTTDPDSKRHAYMTSLELLKSFIVNSKMERLYLYFFEDFAIEMRRIGRNSAQDSELLLSFVTDKEIKQIIKKISGLNDGDFRNYIKEFRPRTPITDGHTSFPCP